MSTSCNTHDYDGKLREKWFEMRPILIEKYLPNCLSFDDTLKQIEEWLEKKYYNVKRIGRARRSIKILTSHRRGNFDSKNDIDVEELLPILWNKVKNQEDIHDTFYEQLCDITGGSCSQGRSTRLFQFLFLFDLPTNIETLNQQQTKNTSEEKQQQQQSNIDKNSEDDQQQSNLDKKSEDEQQQSPIEKESEETQQLQLENKPEDKEEQHPHTEERLNEERSSHIDEKSDEKQQLILDEKPDEKQQLILDEKPEEKQDLHTKQESDQVEEINISSTETK